jgi:hypothetical protein
MDYANREIKLMIIFRNKKMMVRKFFSLIFCVLKVVLQFLPNSQGKGFVCVQEVAEKSKTKWPGV